MKYLKLLICLAILSITATGWTHDWVSSGSARSFHGYPIDKPAAADDGKYIVVDWANLKFTYGTPPGGGDMLAAVWDGDTDGFIDPDAGGFGIDTSALTGVPSVSAGTWSVAATLTHELGGLETDVNAYSGLVGITAGTTTEVNTAAELETFAGLGAFANEYLDDANAAAMIATLGIASAATIAATYQPLDADLTSIAALGSAADKMLYTTALATWAETALTAFGRSILDDINEATFKATVNLEAGTDVQAQNATLQTIADASDVPGANLDIVNTTAETGIAADDLVIIYDVTAAANRAMTRGNFVTGIGAGQAITLDLGDDGGNDSVDLGEIAITGDGNSIFTEPSADKLLIAVANNWPTADVAVLANTGDSATAFFSSGTVEEAYIHADIMRDSEWTAGTATAQGKLELATDAEAITGTDTARAITAANLKAVLEGGTFDLTGSTITFGLVAGDIPDISATYEPQLVNSAGLLAALSDETGTGVAVFGTNPTLTAFVLGGAITGIDSTDEFRATAGQNVVVQLGDSAGTNKLSVQDSDGVEIWYLDSNGSQYTTAVNNPWTALLENDGVSAYFQVYDTTADQLEFSTDNTAGSNVLAYLVLEGAGAGNFNITGGYLVDGGALDYADIAASGNTSPTGTWDFTGATLNNIGGGTIADGTNYVTISNDINDDTVDEMIAAIEAWAVGVGAGTVAALSDTTIGAYTGGHILIGDNSDSYDNKAIGGDATLASDGTLTVIGAALSTASTAGDLLTAGGINFDATPTDSGDIGYVTANDAFTMTAILDNATGNQAAFNFNYTTNKASSGNDDGMVLNMTDTASPGTSYLMRLQVGGTDYFTWGLDGVFTAHQSALAISANAAATGAIRLANNETINFRNAANDGDLLGMKIEGSDGMQIGDSNVSSIDITVAGNIDLDGESITLGNDSITIDAAGDMYNMRSISTTIDITAGQGSTNDADPNLKIIADADVGAGTTDHTFSIGITQDATPGNATWAIASSAGSGYTFDKAVAVTGNLSATTIISDGVVGGYMTVTSDADGHTVSATEVKGGLIVETGNQQTVVLPSVVAGMNICVHADGADGSAEVYVDLDAGDHFEYDGTTMANGEYIYNDSDLKGDRMCFIGIDADTWLVWYGGSTTVAEETP